MILAMRTGDTQLEQPKVSMGSVDRFLELDRASASGRFRSATSAELQYQGALKGSFKLDGRGKFAVRAGAFTGSGFTGGWDGAIHLKQLYLDVEVVPRASIQVGGLDIAHGESTEVTSYDFDGYLMGERLRYERSHRAFDSLTVTLAHLGDLDSPSVFDRFSSLSEPNYAQLLWTKRFFRRLGASAEYTSTSEGPTWRQAFRLDLARGFLPDVVQFENYQRRGADPGYGFGLYGQRRLARALVLGVGFAQIDRSGLNSDRFPRGKRVYGTALFSIGRELSVSLFFSQAVGGAGEPSLRRRLDVALSYNVLERLPLSGS
jgi:hypothetical protein